MLNLVDVAKILAELLYIYSALSLHDYGIKLRVWSTALTLKTTNLILEREQQIALGNLPELFSEMLGEEKHRHLVDLRVQWLESKSSLTLVEWNTLGYFLAIVWADVIYQIADFF